MTTSAAIQCHLRLVVSTVAICAVLACVGPQAEPVAEPEPAFDPAAEAQVILALERQWSERLAADDVDWIMDLHAEDAWQLPPNAEPIAGPEALRAAWEGMALTEGLEISWEPTFARVSESGDMAYDLGSATITTADGQSQAAKYLVVWVREGGRWKVAADMFSLNAPPGG
jgi:ketosteroid isomerase-like protein